MNPSTHLSGSHLHTYNLIFQHPTSHNLRWKEVHALFYHLGHVEEAANGNLRVTYHEQVLVLQPARTKDVAETAEVMELRHFLQRAETAKPPATAPATHWLLVIDHRQARIFRCDINRPVAQQILPHKPEDYFRQAHHSIDFSRGKEKPDPNSFFEPVAKALGADGEILIFGTGTGASSEMDQFNGWLKLHHAETAQRVIGCLAVDEHHLTDGQLLAKAREFYAGARPALP